MNGKGEPMNDLIDRRAAIDALIDALAWTWSGVWSEKAAIDAIKNLPSAEPERKTGKWIITSEFEDYYYAKCNQCNITEVFYFNQPLTKFCPNCGAKMDGERRTDETD